MNKNIWFSSLFCDLSFDRNYFCALKIMWRIFMPQGVGEPTMLLEVVIFNGTIAVYTHSKFHHLIFTASGGTFLSAILSYKLDSKWNSSVAPHVAQEK